MAATNWTDLVVLGEDGQEEITGEERIEALRQLRATGSMHTYLLAALPGQEDLDPSEWGPSDDEIDWTGFEAAQIRDLGAQVQVLLDASYSADDIGTAVSDAVFSGRTVTAQEIADSLREARAEHSQA